MNINFFSPSTDRIMQDLQFVRKHKTNYFFNLLVNLSNKILKFFFLNPQNIVSYKRQGSNCYTEKNQLNIPFSLYSQVLWILFCCGHILRSSCQSQGPSAFAGCSQAKGAPFCALQWLFHSKLMENSDKLHCIHWPVNAGAQFLGKYISHYKLTNSHWEYNLTSPVDLPI